ncbi:MAG: hypothetical protein JSW49_04245 [candidate division WOR-3 bacterium]|nr:MAG: hypothetical protein JSW49_04245 [candidate division WOR-3 bacterium]
MKKVFWAVPLIVIMVVLFLIWFPTEERMLKSDIHSLRKAVESESVDRVMEYIDLQYLDDDNLTRDDITALIGQFFMEVDSIRVQIGRIELEIDSTSKDKTIFASCSLGVRVLARYEGERVLAYGGLVRPGTVRASFKKTGDKYKIYYAKY